VSSLRRAVSGGGGLAPSAGLLNTVPTTSMGAADTSERLARRSTQRDHSAAAVEARRLEEAQADQAEAEAIAIARARALAQQQEQHTRRLAHRQSGSRSNTADGPRFHIDEHSDEEEAGGAAKQPAHAASHAPAVASGSDAAQGRPWLDRIKDPGQSFVCIRTEFVWNMLARLL